MLCGVSRLSPRSLIATATFFATSVIVARIFPSPLAEKTLPAYIPTYPSNNYLPALAALVVAAVVAKDLLRRFLPALCVSSETTESKDPNGVKLLPYLLSGLTFSVGLVASGMVSPLKVLGFLRLPPPLDNWDPSLAMVIFGGVIPNAIDYYFVKQSNGGKPKPNFAWEEWRVPNRSDVDWKLIVGATLFGAGWGLGGVCPGPAITTFGQLVVTALSGGEVALQAAVKGWAAFAVNMVLGMAGARYLLA